MHSRPSNRRSVNLAGCLLLGAAYLVFSAPAANAAQSSAQFNVTVRLQSTGNATSGPNPAFCRTTNAPGSFGATVITVCSTGALVDISPGRSGMPWSPMHGGAYRFVTEVWRVGDTIQVMETDTGVGTVTSWRAINLANREYLEKMVAW